MKILIIGGAGFIGKNLVRALSKDLSHEITVIDCFINSKENYFRELFPAVKLLRVDITELSNLEEIIKGIDPDYIYHLAANSDIRLSSEDPFHDLKNTFMTTASLCRLLPSLNKPAVFFASSSAVYGPKDGPIGESTTPNPISSYGWMKYTSEIMLDDNLRKGLIGKLVIFRFPNVVGQYMTHGVIFDLINKLRANPNKLEVLGDGTQEKPYVLASNLVKVISQSLSEPLFESGIYNISSKDRAKVSEIVEAIGEITELTPKITYGTSRHGWKGDVAEYELLTDKISSSVLSPIFTPSREAIAEAVKLYWHESK